MRATLGRPCESLIVMGEGGPGSVCFLQRPEGELQSSSSWPLHHRPDTDRLLLLGFLAPPRPAPFLSSSSFSTLSIPLTQYSPPPCCFFPACFYLGFCPARANQIRVLWPFADVWPPILSVQHIGFIQYVYSSPPCLAPSHHLTLCRRDTSNQYLSPAHSLIPRSFPTPPNFYFFFFYLHTHSSSEQPKPFPNLWAHKFCRTQRGSQEYLFVYSSYVISHLVSAFILNSLLSMSLCFSDTPMRGQELCVSPK